MPEGRGASAAAAAVAAVAAVLAGAAATSRAAGAGRDGSAFVGGTIGDAVCESVRVGGAAAARGRDGRFAVRLDLPSPRYLTLECGGRVSLFLSPGDSLSIAWRTKETEIVPRFSGRGAEVNRFLAEEALLEPGGRAALIGTYFRLAELDEDEFLAGFDSLWTVVGAPLEAFLASGRAPGPASDAFARAERARIAFSRAEGLLRYPTVHRQIEDDPWFEVGNGFYRGLDSLDLDEPAFLDLEEFRSYLHADLDVRADSALRADSTLQRGDNRRTRARYAAAMRRLSNRAVRDHALAWILENHVAELGTRGLDSLLTAFRRDCTDTARVREVVARFEKEDHFREGHTVEIYKSVDGVDLETHILFPEGHASGDRRPAFVWFHGAGWIRGAWYWCLGLCEHFRSKGMVLVEVEYRLNARHNSTPLESIADAQSAIRWVRANAARLGVDPKRIVASGFSAGGHLAAATACLEDAGEPAGGDSVSCVPDALVLFGACVDPTMDPWYRQVVAPRGLFEDGSPAHHVRPGLPPTVLVHGTLDKNCSFEAAEQFADSMKAAGNRCDLHAFPGRGHFFLLERTPDRDEALGFVDAFLETTGMLGAGGGAAAR